VTVLAAPAIALLLPVLVVLTVKLIARRARGADDANEDDRNDGGQPRDRPPRFPRSPGGEHVDWWPEFERAFASYEAARSGAPPRRPLERVSARNAR
jgi:hypothetical protein